jgi:predicted ATPase
VLRSQHLLLVLDNCEHLLDGCATLIQRLLDDCDGLRVLTTSREPLGIAGELVWRVPSLTVPKADAAIAPVTDLADYGAVGLFVDRARLAQPAFVLTEASAPAVVEICRRVDGIPLAIELAAARIPVLTLGQIAARLDDPLELLTRGPRNSVPRHRTLRATLDWSYDLLPASEQRLLRRLAVFSDGWTLEAAETVGGGNGIVRHEILDLLSRLVDASLVIVEEQADQARYRLLEPVRQYALARLQQATEEAAVRDRHTVWCLALAEQAEPELWKADQLRWFARLEAEHDNLRAALAWSMRAHRDAQIALRLAGALHRFWDIGGYHGEGRHWLEEVLRTAAHQQTTASVKALYGAGLFAHRQNDFVRATTLGVQALELARQHGDTWYTVLALTHLARAVEMQQRDYEKARRMHESAVALARGRADWLAIAIALDGLGRLAEYEGDCPRAEVVLGEALALHRERGDRDRVADGDRTEGAQDGGPAAFLQSQRHREQPAHAGIQAVERPEEGQ